ncbi:pyruvate formate-lyase-activating protein [Streptococcus mutans]|uniref:pyruvate formate-lyase-activating protein n=1 Tax=Streptococcus mutans TaxID=1309 RepID=UPI0002B5B41A|nr:pyruvate formate-lyase-activating protein [Streptococcus mutans]EMB88849.1 pyruvate formate-lyase activating enzyme [Streptococcus mutans N29]MCB5008221.1 pyruvate formate lyase-activating protein [Streptococcus mutans]MCB5030646.1 pyruvate formate lyase-activating protein [Streptococcus mutans]MCB5051090.1 pyruvate formate lyase-activating protein [Streptococcus mutans]
MIEKVDYEKVTGLVNSTESFGSVDGPGIRFVVFMQGCQMRCQYCHNPDTWAMKNDRATERTAGDVFKEALRFKDFWGDTGGITVSGGEATLQMDFLIALFSLAKEKGIHTTLDTCALTFRNTPKYLEKYEKLMAVTDLVLLDIKEINPDQHKIVTGHSNKTILACARYLSNIGKPVWIRHVLVPGLTDRDEDLIKLGEYVKTLKNVQRFEILPYHTMGEFKWRELGIPYPLEGVKPPTPDRVRNAKKLMHTETYEEYKKRINH